MSQVGNFGDSAQEQLAQHFAKVPLQLCACMGPMYGEPHCPCTMDRLGLPKNIAAREAEQKRATEELNALFGPGGLFHKEKK